MDWSYFSGKSIGLLGAGKENISLITHLLKAGASVTICDKSSPRERWGVEVVSGSSYLGTLDKFDIVFRSPGLPIAELNKSLSNTANPPEVSSATNLLLQLISKQVIAVTGTKGKGTTASMIRDIIAAANKKVILAGNIGNSVFDEWKSIDDDTTVVMELSSFQLEDVTVSPHIAVVLPITPDHLQPLSERSPNFHPSLSDYIKAKQNIVAFQGGDDIAVYSKDSQPSAHIGQVAPGKKISVSAKVKADVYVDSGNLHIDNHLIDLFKDIELKGDHVLHNAAVACAVAEELEIEVATMVKGLRSFKPLPHRMQEIGVFSGIKFVNDSYSTTPQSTIAAMSAYAEEPVTLILGGSSKGADFDELAKACQAGSVKTAVIIGREAGKIQQALKKFAPKVKQLTGFSTFRSAVESAIHHSEPGSVVLLSPACASKDMFESAADRGEKFIKIIHELS